MIADRLGLSEKAVRFRIDNAGAELGMIAQM